MPEEPTMPGKVYAFTNFRELLERVPCDRVLDCAHEMAQGLALCAITLEAARATGQPPEVISALMPDEFTWTDDGKDGLSLTAGGETVHF